MLLHMTAHDHSHLLHIALAALLPLPVLSPVLSPSPSLPVHQPPTASLPKIPPQSSKPHKEKEGLPACQIPRAASSARGSRSNDAFLLFCIVLVGLYEEGEKPSNALDYVKKNFGSANSGASAADADEVQSLKEEIATLKAQNEDLEARLREATGGDADGE